MSSLLSLEFQSIRNLHPTKLELCPEFNWFYGENGSGKTSLLEAVYILSLARSFRTQSIENVIAHGAKQLVVHGRRADGQQLGVEKSKTGKHQLRVSGSEAKSVSELTQQLPLLLINADCFQLLSAGSQNRRKALDWGVFHVEHSFGEAYNRYNRALKHRNSALKQKRAKEECLLWDTELERWGELMDHHRSHYLHDLIPAFIERCESLLPMFNVTLDYDRGWEAGQRLGQALKANYFQDLQSGYTRVGPHRADLIFKANQRLALHELSRGQQKLLLCALKTVQGALLERFTQKKCVYLLDDLQSELDQNASQSLCNTLKKQGVQVFVTCIDNPKNSGLVAPEKEKVFHVKHGQLIVIE